MALSWNKLSDRCALFNNNKPRALYVELLKEAEKELVRKCDILESSEDYNTSDIMKFSTSGSSRYKLTLPQSYKKMISVIYDKEHLSPCSQADLEYTIYSDRHVLQEGTPTKYYIKNNELYFDKEPPLDKSIVIKFYSNLISNQFTKYMIADKLLPQTIAGSQTSYAYIQTDLGHELNGQKGSIFAKGASAQVPFTEFVFWKMFSQNNDFASAVYKFTITDYTLTGTLKGAIRFDNYHHIAPIIPDQYHLDLCDYALAIASDDPNMHDKHMTMWLNKVEEIKNEDADRDLIHEVKADYYV